MDLKGNGIKGEWRKRNEGIEGEKVGERDREKRFVVGLMGN